MGLLQWEEDPPLGWVGGGCLKLHSHYDLYNVKASQYALKEGVITKLCKTVIEYLLYAKDCAK